MKGMQLPYVPDEVFEVLHEFSVFLLKDDKHDLGYYRYYRRKGHYYMGKPAPDHPGMLHHWQVGMAGLVMAQLGGLINLARSAVTSSDMAENIPESELYDESTIVIDLPSDAVHEVPTPQLFQQEESTTENEIQITESEVGIEEEPTVQLTTIQSLTPIAKL